MNRKKKGGILKKVSAISFLAVIIAMVILLGMNSVSAGDTTHIINITEPEPGSEVNKPEIYVNGTILFTDGTVDESIKNATLTYYDSPEVIIPVDNGTFSYPITLSQGKHKLKIKIETEEGPEVAIQDVTYYPPHHTTTEEEEEEVGAGEETEEEENGRAEILYWPWIIVGIIVIISFLIFFVIVEREEGELFEYIFIIWIAFAVIVPIVVFFVLKYLRKSGFAAIHVIVAIIAAILLPISVSLVYNFITDRKKENLERSGEKSGIFPAPSYSTIKFKVFDEGTKQPISDAKIVVTGSNTQGFVARTDPSGIHEHLLEDGIYEYRIEPVGEYKPKSEKLSVEGSSGVIPIPLSKRTGNLTVQVKDRETGNPVPGLTVSVSGVEKKTDEQGKALFSSVIIGAKEINVDEIKGVYSSETKTCEIIEDTTNEVTVSIKSFLRIPIDKERKLNALRNQLQDNYRRVSTYDPCIPSYYKSIVDNMVNLVNGMVRNPMLFVGSKNNPGELIGHLIDAIDTASREIIEVMTSKRNLDVYSAAMKLEKAEVRATPVDFADSRVASYIRDSNDFYNSYYHTAQSKLFEIDTDITKKTSEMNVLPVSGLWRVARTVLNETSAGSAETYAAKNGAMLLVADILLDYTGGMLKDTKIIERLKIMVI